ncbi:flagellar basal body rod protein FlgB [Acetobacterium sp.]|uniref:flagellar basal body rod protein FlgB n=1 Tax=Acetobacterium sp. TaxID=1872094 RepID=UPI002F3F70A0
MIGDSITTALYQKALDGTWQRQRAIGNNIANGETPGYKAVKVSFEDTLKSEVGKIQSNSATTGGEFQKLKSISDSDISVSTNNATSNRADGNNVDLDAENVDMSKTVLEYNYLVRGLSDTYSRLKYAISEGKR